MFGVMEINTITCYGSIYKEGLDMVHISALSDYIEIKAPVIYTKYVNAKSVKLLYDMEYVIDNHGAGIKNPWYDPDKKGLLVPAGEKNSIIYNGKKMLICTIHGIEPKIKRDFDNSFTIGMILGKSNVNCKIYINGYILVTGCSSISDIEHTFDHLKIILSDVYRRVNFTKNNDTIIAPHVSGINRFAKLSDFSDDDKKKIMGKLGIFVREPVPTFSKISLMAYKFNSNIEFDQEKIQKIINESDNSDIYATFENSKNRTLKINHTLKGGNVITFMLFRKGTIMMTNIKSSTEAMSAYTFICGFIEKNKDEISRKYDIDNIIRLLDSQKIIQKSEEWLNMRGSVITASEVFKVVMKNPPFNETRDKFINEKIQYRLTGKKQFTGNSATRHGELFEPIARKLYEYMENNRKSDHNFIVKVYELGFLMDDNKVVGASPDGLVIRFSRDCPDINADIKKIIEHDHEVTKNNHGNLWILDMALLEIKCPKNYKSVDGDLKKNKSQYYWQIQQQLYVTKVKFCVFFNCKFKEIDRAQYIKILENDSPKKIMDIFYTRAGVEDINLNLTTDVIYAWEKSSRDTKNFIERYWILDECEALEVDFNETRYMKKYTQKIVPAQKRILLNETSEPEI